MKCGIKETTGQWRIKMICPTILYFTDYAVLLQNFGLKNFAHGNILTFSMYGCVLEIVETMLQDTQMFRELMFWKK